MLKASLSENMQRIDKYIFDTAPILLKNNSVRTAYNTNYIRLNGSKKDLDLIALRLEKSQKFQNNTSHKIYRTDDENLYVCSFEDDVTKKAYKELVASLIGEQIIAYQADMLIKHQEFIDALKALNEEIA